MTPRKSFTAMKSALLLTTPRLTYAFTTSLMTKLPTFLSKACRRVSVTLPRLTRIQLTNAAPTDGCIGESINSKEFQPCGLIGRTFLMDAQPDGQTFRAAIVEGITPHQQDYAKQPELVKFRISVNNEQYEATVTYNKILLHIEKEENNSAESAWRFREIVGNEGPRHRTLDPGRTSKWSGRMGSRP